jgi:Flp pilus assembly protein TadG
MTAIATLPLILFAGVAIDCARQIQLYRSMQNAADAAALAGATLLSEANYADDVPVLVNAYLKASTAGVNGTVTLPATVAVTPDSVTVTVSASIPSTLLSLLVPSLPTSVTAVAGGPEATITISATPQDTNAGDLNSVYVYAVKADGTKDFSNRSFVINNNINTCRYQPCISDLPQFPPGVPIPPVPFSLGLGERIAFELDNVTGGRGAAYYNNMPNTYGSMPLAAGKLASQAAANVFYSSDYPATLNTVPARPASGLSNGYSPAHQEAMVNGGYVNFDSTATGCYVYQSELVTSFTVNGGAGSTGTIGGPGQQQNVTVANNGSPQICADVTPGSPYNINPTCLELNGQTLNIDWNDTGNPISVNGVTVGDSDRYIGVPNNTFTDMSYSVSCAVDAGPYLRVVLTR